MISVIILAAGASKRMGRPKMLLPWDEETVLSHVVSVFHKAGMEDINVITGGAREQVEDAISHLNIKIIYNENFAKGEMLSSIQCGIQTLTYQTEAILIGLGDQPQVQEGSVRMVWEAYRDTGSNIVVPSYQMRRGHPWLVARTHWSELQKMESHQSPRDFLNAHHEEIHYVNIEDSAILADLDTPEDYQRWQHGFHDKLARRNTDAS